ncbi:MAG: DUF6152 family protein [Gammaproteobacteria bacterium]
MPRVKHAAVASVIALAFVAIGTGLDAHHSSAPFNMQTERTLAGTVKQVDWTNPHIWIWVDVQNDKGGVDTWGIEGMSPNYLERRGWTKSTLKAGDKISVSIRPMRDGSTAGMFMRATLADGKVLTPAGAQK